MLVKKTIYLDYQASAPLDKSVFNAMMPFWEKYAANPHSNDHILGWKSNQAIQNARQKIASALNADADEIIFTSGATEANNFFIKGIGQYLKQINKTKIITSAIEHKCVLSCFEYLSENGFEAIYLKPNADGILEAEQLEEFIDESVGLVSVMMVNNEIGTVQPMAELATIAHEYGSLFHTDAAQAPIFIKIDVTALGVDMVSLSSHKIHGPKGIGAAFLARDVKDKLAPLIHGGGQEDGLRSGTLPTPLCVGFGEAFHLAALNAVHNGEKLKNLSALFWNELKQKIPEIELNGSKETRHPGNLNIRFPGLKAQDFLQTMQPHLAASTGAACNSGIESPSYVLREIGLSADAAAESIRFSFGKDQCSEEIIQAVAIIYETYKKLLPLLSKKPAP